MLNDILGDGIDLNEIVKGEVMGRIIQLEKELKEERKLSYEKVKENITLKEQLKLVEDSQFLIKKMADTFNSFKPEGDPDQYGYKSVNSQRYACLCKIMEDFFGIKTKQSWISQRGDGWLGPYLAVGFYEHKETVISLYSVLNASRTFDAFGADKVVPFIKSFVMPYDYPKETVMDYAQNPKYNTNGSIFGISKYWMESGAGLTNMPHDLIMRNKHILDPDIFAAVIKTIEQERDNWYYLLELPGYNKGITAEHISRMGRCLLKLARFEKRIEYKEVASFISKNLVYFDEETLNYLYYFVSHDNQFKTLDFRKMPKLYQKKYLKKVELKECLKLLTYSDIGWTDEEKRLFLKEL